ncbi:MAG: virulence RhuM family protein [Rhodobacteraceae bacterium]|nr:virulence RhuM family protein [Paracoccaceae bacterium]MYF45207.1 virulence RhuM family protein [Paracoccaceae bacterium]MYI91781.1 virulence RhuM family protein [Paracoccaceae bacterium]
MRNGELIIYQTEDGLTEINLTAIDGTVWLTQDEIADLFDKGRSTVTEHIKNIFSESELDKSSVCRNFRRTAKDGKDYDVLHYNLDMILAVGFRVRSPRGTQFRRWANTVLNEYLVKGFAMDDERLKQTENWDYFDEWLARIQDIRASEKRFYQKVKDLYATAVDYDKTSEQAQLFFKKVQNKMLWAVTGKTAAELIADRSNSKKANMGLTSFKGRIVRKSDIGTAKNYLHKEEIEELNRIVIMYLDYAEDQAKKRKTINMYEWSDKLDAFLEFNERDLLTHAGKLKMELAKRLASERYFEFDIKRKKAEAIAADEEDIKDLEIFQKKLSNRAS